MLLTKDRSFYKSLLTLSIPIALQNLLTLSMGLADNIMASGLGDEAVSGIYAGGQIQTLLQVFTVGIEGVVLTLSAQYWGRKDTDSVKRILSIGIKAAVGVGILISAACFFLPSFVVGLFSSDAEVIVAGADYLRILSLSFAFFCLSQCLISSMRSVESVAIGFLASGISLAVNVLMNYMLIFGRLGAPALGVRGAAIATLISRICETAVAFIYTFFIDKKLSYKIRDVLKTNKSMLRDFLRYGIPIIAGQLVWAVNLVAGNAIMGRLGGQVLAGLSVANTLYNLSYVLAGGLSGAVGIITAKTAGHGDVERIKEYSKTVQVIFAALGLLTGAAVLLLKQPFISLYGISAAAKSHAATLITVIAIAVIGTCYQSACLVGLVKSGGDVSFVFKTDLVLVFLITLPSAAIALRVGASATTVLSLLKSDQIIKCLVAVIKVNRFNWIKNLTK